MLRALAYPLNEIWFVYSLEIISELITMTSLNLERVLKIPDDFEGNSHNFPWDLLEFVQCDGN